jgi:hypothetical protein
MQTGYQYPGYLKNASNALASRKVRRTGNPLRTRHGDVDHETPAAEDHKALLAGPLRGTRQVANDRLC